MTWRKYICDSKGHNWSFHGWTADWRHGQKPTCQEVVSYGSESKMPRMWVEVEMTKQVPVMVELALTKPGTGAIMWDAWPNA